MGNFYESEQKRSERLEAEALRLQNTGTMMIAAILITGAILFASHAFVTPIRNLTIICGSMLLPLFGSVITATAPHFGGRGSLTGIEEDLAAENARRTGCLRASMILLYVSFGIICAWLITGIVYGCIKCA